MAPVELAMFLISCTGNYPSMLKIIFGNKLKLIPVVIPISISHSFQVPEKFIAIFIMTNVFSQYLLSSQSVPYFLFT